jgi:hypothetical protein
MITEIMMLIDNRISIINPGSGTINARTIAIIMIGTDISLALKPC